MTPEIDEIFKQLAETFSTILDCCVIIINSDLMKVVLKLCDYLGSIQWAVIQTILDSVNDCLTSLKELLEGDFPSVFERISEKLEKGTIAGRIGSWLTESLFGDTNLSKL